MKKRFLLLSVALCSVLVSVMAQAVTTASSSMMAGPLAAHVSYDITADGVKKNFVAGMGGWSWDFFALQQRNWVGKEYINIARVGFMGRHSTSATTPTSLSDDQKASIDTELSNISQTGAKRLLLLCDLSHDKELQESDWYNKYYTSSTIKRRRNNYVKDIELAVKYIEEKGYTVVAVAPFNEPDYDALKISGKTANAFNAVAEVMQGNSTLKGRVFGPNTLNNTNGKNWYSTVKNNINFVNTHQLDGAFQDLVSFWDTGINDGKRAIADEMHNVLEAMVAVNHGAEYGTWWAYDGVARAEFSHLIADGKQIAYKEDHDHWMVSGIYRYDTEKDNAKIIIGTSERQAVANTIGFMSKRRLAYYDGYGPAYDYTEDVPGGEKGSYQVGQTNAERLIQINTGEDVPIEPVNGKYKIVNKMTSKVLSLTNGNASVRDNVYQWADGELPNQSWDVYPVDKKSVADYSYVVIRNSNTSTLPLYLDAQAWAMDNGANVSVWSDGDDINTPANTWQRWHLEYVGDGYYRVINYYSGLYLTAEGEANGSNVYQWSKEDSDKQLWKFVPANHPVDKSAPSVPTGLTATAQAGSVKLTWNANQESDIHGYMVYRYNNEANIWECIGRNVQSTTFIDNTCRKGISLRYRIKAIDKAYNFSSVSAEIVAQTSNANALVAHLMAYDYKDVSENKMNAVANGVTTTTDSNRPAFSFDGIDDYMKLPYHVGDMQSMTFAAWVKGGSTTAWQRIFDFGNGEDEYLFLTPTNGSAMRFEIKKNGTVQGLNATTTLGTGSWKHVAVTIGSNGVVIYINGEKNASTTDITLRPSDVIPSMSYLGRSQFDADPAFNGMMSGVRIYNYALSADEVKTLHLSIVSAEEIEAATRNAMAEVEDLLQKKMSSENKNALTQALAKVRNIADDYISKINKGTATPDDSKVWSDAIKELSESQAISDAKASIIVYQDLYLKISEVQIKAAANPRTYGNDVFESELAVIESKYNTCAYADAEIPAAVIELKGILNRYLLADAKVLATDENPIDVTALVVGDAGFDNDSFASWASSPNPTAVTWGGVEFWNTNFNMYQTLYGMPAGTYRLQTRAFYRYGYQDNNVTAMNNGTLKRNAKLYMSHGSGKTATADVMAISDDPADYHLWGNWYENGYPEGYAVPDNPQAAAEAIDNRERYIPKNGYNTVDITVTEKGDLTIGARKDALEGGDWSFFGDFTLYYLGDGENKLVLNEANSNLPVIDESVRYDQVTVTRTLNAGNNGTYGNWNTFVLPYDKEIPAGWEVKELTSSTVNGETISMVFETAESIKAGVPYMVRVNSTVKEFIDENVEVTTKLANVKTDHIEFVGVYESGYVPQGAFFISNNTFYRAAKANNNKIKGFRAYLVSLDANSSAKTLNYSFDDDADVDGIEELENETTVVAIYTLDGKRIDDMQQGVNILKMSNGKTLKVIIK